MTYNEAIRRLANHANQPTDSLATKEDSYLFTLWTMSKRKEALDFSPKVNDIIQCLDAVNIELNGRIPSESIPRPDGAIVRILAGIVGCLIVGGLEYALEWRANGLFEEDVAQCVLLSTWKISKAWNAILAGDIDCLDVHLDDEMLVRDWV